MGDAKIFLGVLILFAVLLTPRCVFWAEKPKGSDETPLMRCTRLPVPSDQIKCLESHGIPIHDPIQR